VAGAYGITMVQASLDNELTYLNRLKSITRAQIQAAAQKYLSTTAYAWIGFLPRRAQ
jgi:predicted Zn-dependent peptidase